MDLDALRQEYETTPLDVADLEPDPIAQIEGWLARWLEVAPVPPDESDAYWAGRPRKSQLAALASEQSSVLRDRSELEERFAAAEAQLDGGPRTAASCGPKSRSR